MTNNAMIEILQVLQKHKVPLQHGVSLICKMNNIGMADLAESCGYHRNYLNMSLRGIFSPSTDFRAAITKKLGIDPWQYRPAPSPSEK